MDAPGADNPERIGAAPGAIGVLGLSVDLKPDALKARHVAIMDAAMERRFGDMEERLSRKRISGRCVREASEAS